MTDVLEHGDPDRSPRRWLTRRSVLLVAAGALLAGGGFGLVLLVKGGRQGPPTTLPSGLPTASSTTEAGSTSNTHMIGSASLDAGDQVTVALVPGGAWLSSWTMGTLTRVVSGREPRVTSRVRLGRPDEAASSLVYGAGSLWVVDASTNSLLALDPVTGQLRRRLALAPWGTADTVAFGGHTVWVACSDQLGGAGPRERVIQVDPTTLKVVGKVSLPGEGENLLVVANRGDIWVGGATPLTRIDPSTRSAVSRYPAGTAPLGINGGVVWTGSPDGLVALDAHSGHVLAKAELNGAPPFVAVDPYGRAWTPSPTGDQGIDLIRPTGFSYRFAQYADRVVAVAVDDTSLWVYTGARVIVFDIRRMNIN